MLLEVGEGVDAEGEEVVVDVKEAVVGEVIVVVGVNVFLRFNQLLLLLV